MKNTHDRNRRQILGILVNILTVVSLLCCTAIWAIPHNVAGVALKLLLMVSVWMPPLACKKMNERLDVLCRIENARLRCGSEPIVNRRVNVCPQPSVKVAPRYISTPKVVTPTTINCQL